MTEMCLLELLGAWIIGGVTGWLVGASSVHRQWNRWMNEHMPR